MPPFPKPDFPFEYDLSAEVKRLLAHKLKRGIPKREPGKLLVATWNIANLGAQARRDQDKALIAQIIAWFDLVAVQECRENYGDLYDIQRHLPKSYRVVMSDASGNDERMTFLYDSRKLKLLEEIGEIALPPAEYRHVKLPGVAEEFKGFDRTPFLASFAAGHTSFTLVNVHLYFGDEQSASVGRRALETFAVARWADQRARSEFSFTRELMAMGDFNMPRSNPGDPIFDALTRFGLELPDHSTQIASSIMSDANYDQVAFLPATTRDLFTGKKGVFDFDNALFPALWAGGANAEKFKAYLRYYISDHRPMWVQVNAA
ncbi:MAG: endonuclease/exonuclease/phosphatase family protein [Chloroflexi bacterium]|nr:endonuclease/exonuclease/phosphatase family protein [Chloroflexota bacterium]